MIIKPMAEQDLSPRSVNSDTAAAARPDPM